MNAINQCMHCIELAACTVFYNAMCSTVNIQPINASLPVKTRCSRLNHCPFSVSHLMIYPQISMTAF